MFKFAKVFQGVLNDISTPSPMNLNLLKFSLLIILSANSFYIGFAQITNILSNGGFENGQNNWSGWNSNITISNDNPRAGNNCAHFVTRTSIEQGIVSLDPGKTYKLSVWIRINSMTGNDWGGIRFSVISYDWSQWYDSQSFQPQNRPSGTWFNEIIEFVPTTNQHRVQIGFFGGSGWDVDFSYDDVILYEQINQNDPPRIDSVQLLPTSGLVPFTVSCQIFASDEDGVIENYIIDTGDGAVYFGHPNINHVYRIPGNYKLRVTVVDDNATTDTISYDIQASSPNNYFIDINAPQPQSGSNLYSTNQQTIYISGIREYGSGDVFWVNNKTKQSGFTPVNNNIFNIPSLALLPGLNIIHVQSLFGNENFLKDEIAVFFMPDSYSGPIISNILPNKNNPKQYERVDVIFDVSSIADNPFFPFDENISSSLGTGSGISVDMEFTNGILVKKQPAFLDMNYTKTGNTLIPSGEFTWKVRMAFKETGIWTSRIIARDSVGETDIAGPVFTVLADNLENGYISVSSEDDRYFKYDNNTLFFGMGHGTSVSGPENVDDEIQNWKENKLNFGRFWLSSVSPFSDSWSSWATHHPMQNNGYMPPPLLSSKQKYASGQFSWRVASPAIENQNTPAIFRGFWDGSISVSPNTTYRILARVKTINIVGEGGLVLKTGGWLGTDVVNQGVGTNITPYMRGDNGWTYLTGTIQTNPGQTTLNYLYLVLENCTGEAYLDELTVQELQQDGSLRQNILSKWNANTHHYLDPIKSKEADYMIEKAHNHGIHYKIVIHEKDD